ncbi:VanZ family protein [Arthrobacter sp. MA-N2]|uniref:VanZ family protein n=1 Tax=Arthrobacter sp. MA-N2 TaxID=1101188 RepID=UPI0012DE1862
MALGAAASGVLELSQLLFLPHRSSSVQDILMNTVGFGIGLMHSTPLKRQPLRHPALHEPSLLPC